MKTKVFLLLLFFGMIGLASAQIKAEADYLIHYDVEIRNEKNTENTSSELHRLYTNKSQSYYVNDWEIIKDSVIQASIDKAIRTGSSMVRYTDISSRGNSFTAEVYKDISQQKIWVQYELFNKTYQYEETDLPLAWEITNQTKEIEGEVVYKANLDFAGRTYQAWFNPEVPIPEGPYVFHGLPGLIFEIYDSERVYVFELVSITQLKETYSIDPEKSNFERLAKKEVQEMYNKVKEQSFKESKKFSPHNPTSAKQRRQRALERAQKKENHIEFW